MNHFLSRNRPKFNKETSDSTVSSLASASIEQDLNNPASFVRMSSMSMNNHAMTVKTVHSLEAELIRLRESTKDALQQSWEEVETLQQQCAAHLDITTQLENDVIEARRKEEYWHKRCLDAEFQLLQGSHDKKPEKNDNSASRPSLNPMLLMTWPSMGLTGFQGNDTPSIGEDFSLETKSEKGDNLSHQESAKAIVDLELKLQDRESAVSSLENTVERHIKAMHSMQAEMQCMMETQRIKEKKNQATFRRKESFLEEQMSTLQKEASKKDGTIASQKKRSTDYKRYIEELASELETVLTILQRAEKNGVDLSSLYDNS